MVRLGGSWTTVGGNSTSDRLNAVLETKLAPSVAVIMIMVQPTAALEPTTRALPCVPLTRVNPVGAVEPPTTERLSAIEPGGVR